MRCSCASRLSSAAASGAEDVTLLTDGEATRGGLLAEFDALAERARDEPALFFFAGHGSRGADGAPVLVPADGRPGGAADVALAELARRAAGARELISIIDAGWVQYGTTGSGTRSLPATADLIGAPRDLRPPSEAVAAKLDPALWQVGTLGVVHAARVMDARGSMEVEVGPGGDRPSLLGDTTEIHGRLSYALARALLDGSRPPSTYSAWLSVAEGDPAVKLVIFGARAEDFLFDCTAVRKKAMAAIRAPDDQPIAAAQAVLRRLLCEREAQHDRYPGGRLSAGVAAALLADFAAGIPLLEQAASLYDDPEVLAAEKGPDPLADAWRAEAHYQLGRALRDSEHNFTRAVDQLNVANQVDPDNPRVLYHLGLAIRAMVERETLAKAEQVLTRYLALGAPLGHEDEVRRFLGSRGTATVDRR
jgi:hypothetical protein